ncbi:MAG: metalloregulator ArsR/SmtB family transcription factor [archaeon]
MNTKLFVLHAELCKTLADPKRLEILYLLGSSEKSVSQLAEQLKLRQANISQHLAILRQKGVVSSRKNGTTVYYKIAFPKMVKACNLIRDVLLEQIESKQKIVWEVKK